jgi:two-component system chemotaxis sensor kinase CheA
LLNTKGAIQDPTQGLVVIVEGVGQKVGLLVDEVIAQQQVVIKNMGEGLGETQFISGAAILSDGHVGLILNVEEIASQFGMKQNREFSGVGPSRPSRTTCGTVTDA